LRRFGVRQLGGGEDGFASNELPFYPTSAEDLAQGGNFRLETPLGVLDIIQWIPGIDADNAYATLAADAGQAEAFGIEIQVCSLPTLAENAAIEHVAVPETAPCSSQQPTR
jgi:hypothetical protein